MDIPDHEHDYAWNKFDRLACEVCGKAKREVELEQQLAQAREHLNEQMLLANRLQSDLHEVIRQRDDCRDDLEQAREENIKQDETIEFLHLVIDDLKVEREEARALLRRCLISHQKHDGFVLDLAEPIEAVLDEIRAFLAQHPKEQPGGR